MADDDRIVSLLEKIVENVNSLDTRMNTRMDAIEGRLATLEQRVSALEMPIRTISKELTKLCYTVNDLHDIAIADGKLPKRAEG